MYSIIYIVGYMLVVLLSCVSTSENPLSVQKTVSTPYYFGYKRLSNISIQLNVILKNIPTSLTYVMVTRKINTDRDFINKKTKHVNVDKKTREAEFIILEVLEDDQIWFELKLINQNGLCHTSEIIEGRSLYRGYYWDTTQEIYKYYDDNTKYVSDGYCFSPNVCKMVVDLSEECEDKQVSTKNDLKCDKGKSKYICTLPLVQDNMNYNNVVMYQISQNNTLIGPRLELKAGKTINLQFNFELFDNNTFVKLEATRFQEPKTMKSYKITVTDKDISKVNGDVKIRIYSDTKKYEFSCEDYNNTIIIYSKFIYIYVGVINTTDNKIIKTVKDKVIEEIKMEDNGTMLCCMFYDVDEGLAHDKNIFVTRYVINKTLFIYQSHKSTTTNQPELQRLSNKSDNESPVACNKTNDESPVSCNKTNHETPVACNKTNDEPPVACNKTNDESPVACNKTNDGSPATVRLDVMIVVVICVAVMSGGLVLLCTKICRRVKSEKTEEPPQKYKVNNPFYVNLLFKRQCQKEIEEADSHYEEIN